MDAPEMRREKLSRPSTKPPRTHLQSKPDATKGMERSSKSHHISRPMTREPAPRFSAPGAPPVAVARAPTQPACGSAKIATSRGPSASVARAGSGLNTLARPRWQQPRSSSATKTSRTSTSLDPSDVRWPIVGRSVQSPHPPFSMPGGGRSSTAPPVTHSAPSSDGSADSVTSQTNLTVVTRTKLGRGARPMDAITRTETRIGNAHAADKLITSNPKPGYSSIPRLTWTAVKETDTKEERPIPSTPPRI